MAKKTSKKLTKKQHNQAASKALVTAAKQIETQGVEPLPAGSYPFNLEVSVVGELLVGKSTAGGEETTVIDFSPNDVLRGLLATMPYFTQAVSDAVAWHRDSSKEDKKAQDAKTAKLLLTTAKKRKMTKTYTPSGRKGSVSAKPAVTINGTVGSRDIDLGVQAS